MVENEKEDQDTASQVAEVDIEGEAEEETVEVQEEDLVAREIVDLGRVEDIEDEEVEVVVDK